MSFIQRPWAFWRRVQYGSGFLATMVLLATGGFFIFYEDTANCFDGLQNGMETGIDCGGDCVRICAATVQAPRIIWSDSFEIAEGQYNAVAYMENDNTVAATRALRYTFRLLNNGQTVAERSGVSVLPPDSVYPIFEGRILTDGRDVTATEFEVEPVEVWQPASVGIEQFRISEIRLRDADSTPRLDARIENTSIEAAENIEIVTTLFSENNVALTASQTFIDVLPGRTSADIVFTWPESIAKTVTSCSVPSDVVLGIDLSGSMNNDGVNPPQPITSALTAAANFIDRLEENDQVGVVTFASDALIALPLTRDTARARTLVNSLSIAPEEETGFTNTIEALRRIAEEVNGERHDDDARRAAVLLTDGLPTGTTPSEELIKVAVEEAAAMQANGVTLYVIGLGENADRAFIESLVEDPAQAYFAANGSELDQIYQTITGALCERGATRIDIIAKTATNFTPLR